MTRQPLPCYAKVARLGFKRHTTVGLKSNLIRSIEFNTVVLSTAFETGLISFLPEKNLAVAVPKIDNTPFHRRSRLLSYEQQIVLMSFKDGTYYCYCAYVLRISRYSDFLSVMLTNAGIFLRGLKVCRESRS